MFSKNEKNIKSADLNPEQKEKAPEAMSNGSSSTEKDLSKPLLGSKKNWTRVLIGLIIAVIAVIAVIVVLFGFGIYQFGWQNEITKKIYDIVPYPVVVFSGNIISYSEYQSDLVTLDFFYEAQEASDAGSISRPSGDYIKKSVLSRMVRERFLSEAARDRDLTVSDQDISDYYDTIVAQGGGEDEVTNLLTELYNWDESQFKEKVITPYLIRLKVQEFLSTNDEINAAIKEKAEEVLAMINSGEKTFEEAAKEYSEDVTADNGGDLGFFGQGEMVAEFEQAAAALEPGEVSGIVKTQYGYHIIKLLEKVPASDEQAEQFHAAHILLQSKSVDDWINEEMGEKSVTVFISGFEWKKDCGVILSKSETCEDNELLGLNGVGQTGGTGINAGE